MDRLTFRTKLSSRIEKFRLEDFDMEVWLKPLSALDRARVMDTYGRLSKDQESDNQMERMTSEAQAYIVAQGLVDENGTRIYRDDEIKEVGAEIPGVALDKLSSRILEISGFNATVGDAKNASSPIPSGNSSSGSPGPSDGGTPTNSLIN